MRLVSLRIFLAGRMRGDITPSHTILIIIKEMIIIITILIIIKAIIIIITIITILIVAIKKGIFL